MAWRSSAEASPYKESFSKEMNNDNDTNLHLHDQMSGSHRYCEGELVRDIMEWIDQKGCVVVETLRILLDVWLYWPLYFLPEKYSDSSESNNMDDNDNQYSIIDVIWGAYLNWTGACGFLYNYK